MVVARVSSRCYSLSSSASRNLLKIVPLLCLSVTGIASENGSHLYNMSLTELMNVQVSSTTLSSMPLSDSPGSTTIITGDQIARSPARNIRDLLEFYVPGLLFFDNVTNGGDIKIRGLGQNNRNTILLINGRPVNQKTSQGSVVELNNWDMTDIERIDVVRGAGSVTHGAGAISGVINLITKKAGTVEGLRIGVRNNSKYQSNGAYLTYGKVADNIQWLAHASLTRTKGFDDVKIFQLSVNGEFGFKGDSNAFSGSDGDNVANFYADADDKPQIKLSFDMAFLDEWRFWTRYTSAGHAGTVTEKNYQDGAHASREFRDQHFIATLENEHQINSQIQVKSLFSFDSENYHGTNAKQTQLTHNDELNRVENFSENEWFFRSILSYEWSPDLSFAAGLEYSHDYLKEPWGESANTFRAGSSKRNFISEDSIYRGDGNDGTVKDSRVVEFNHGWSADTYSLMAELEYRLWSETTVFLSGRSDKNEFADSMFSPRLALISHLNENNTLKASWQRLLRMNTMEELYTQYLDNIDNEPEKNTTLEFSYTQIHSNRLHSILTIHKTKSEIISWDGTEAVLLGEQKVTGLEIELAYQSNQFTLGFNHSYLKLNEWDFIAKEASGSKSQKISVSDFLFKRDYLTLSSTGDSLNFWSNNTSKLWTEIRLSPRLILHMNAIIMWEYEYGDDLFDMYDKAYAAVDVSSLSAAQLTKYNTNLQHLSNYKQAVADQDAYERNILFNASLIWDLPYLAETKVRLYGQNLINFTDNKRQKSVNYGDVPISSWVEEPRAIWLSVESHF